MSISNITFKKFLQNTLEAKKKKKDNQSRKAEVTSFIQQQPSTSGKLVIDAQKMFV